MTASSKKLAFSSACSSSDTSMVLRNATLPKTGEPDYLESVGNMEGYCLVSCECLSRAVSEIEKCSACRSTLTLREGRLG